MKQDYFHRVAALTPTKMWINNVTPQEAEWAIAAGAMGCTQNPAYTPKMRIWTASLISGIIRDCWSMKMVCTL